MKTDALQRFRESLYRDWARRILEGEGVHTVLVEAVATEAELQAGNTDFEGSRSDD